MSNRNLKDELSGFSTDELVAWLAGGMISVPARIVVGNDDPYFRDAIIARLRHADALLSAAKVIADKTMLMLYRPEPESNEITANEFSAFKRAVAAYEED
jgi:hypothetical protein